MSRAGPPKTASLFDPLDTGRRIASSLPLVPVRDVVLGRDVVDGREDLEPASDCAAKEIPKIFFAIKSSYAKLVKLRAASCPFANSSGVAAALRANSAREYNPASDRHCAHECRAIDTAAHVIVCLAKQQRVTHSAPSAATIDVLDIPGIMGLGVHTSALSRFRHHCTLRMTTP